MNRKQYAEFSRQIVLAVVFLEIGLCIATVLLSCFGFDMTIGVDVIKANNPFAMVVFAAYSGSSAVEKWLVRSGQSGSASSGDDTASNG